MLPIKLQLNGAMLLAYDIENGKADFNTAISRPQKGMASLIIPTHRQRNFHVYLAFITDDRKNRSNSQYLGEFEMKIE